MQQGVTWLMKISEPIRRLHSSPVVMSPSDDQYVDWCILGIQGHAAGGDLEIIYRSADHWLHQCYWSYWLLISTDQRFHFKRTWGPGPGPDPGEEEDHILILEDRRTWTRRTSSWKKFLNPSCKTKSSCSSVQTMSCQQVTNQQRRNSISCLTKTTKQKTATKTTKKRQPPQTVKTKKMPKKEDEKRVKTQKRRWCLIILYQPQSLLYFAVPSKCVKLF